jgi:hypothetical protein
MARLKFKFLPLPSDFDPLDATIDEVASFRRENRWTVHDKLNKGIYKSYLDGRIRKIIFASVKADRERAMKAEPPPPRKRSPGRPRKTLSSADPGLRPLAPSPPEAAAVPSSAQPDTRERWPHRAANPAFPDDGESPGTER